MERCIVGAVQEAPAARAAVGVVVVVTEWVGGGGGGGAHMMHKALMVGAMHMVVRVCGGADLIGTGGIPVARTRRSRSPRAAPLRPSLSGGAPFTHAAWATVPA